ncbi:MAG TPA: hypothetical protein VJ249_04240 [Candidatus Bathyarchaeia archaeon]|nr:hypothetical protein [Candidatus Bathyarchaeia archaeon]
MDVLDLYTMRYPSFWALDTEFLMSGRVNAPEDVMSVQFSNGDIQNSVVLESADALRVWLDNHKFVKDCFAFVALPDLASVEEWLGVKHVSYKYRGSQLIGRVAYGSTKMMVYDARPLLQNFGLRRLEDCGRVVGYPKLAKPAWLGLRAWQNESEHQAFIEYARADAVITSRIVKWLYESFGANPVVHASAGTLARDEFTLSKRLKRVKKTVVLPPLERLVKGCCYAGRSEGFTVGFTPSIVYNDVRSLYPCCLVATRALEIVDAVECRTSDLALDSDDSDLNETRFGWVEGVFDVPNSRWDGLPLRGVNNFYANGVISGFYHTFDLSAANAQVLHVAHAYKPVFQPIQAHNRYADLLLNRLDHKLSVNENMFAKAILNALSGKLGQAHPLARTSNFFAYSTVLAHSHFVMSKLFDKCEMPILAMDTDSVFSQSDMSAKYFELTDGEHIIPISMDAKGRGDLAFFRSKNYILKPFDGSEPVIGRHGWMYFYEDFLKLFDGSVKELHTRADIKHTLLTRQKEAQKLAKGRWKTKPVRLDLAKIKALLFADKKRRRETYDSYGLVMDKRNVDSQAWRYEDLMNMKNENPLNFPIIA